MYIYISLDAICGEYIKALIFLNTNHILVAHIYIYKVVFENFRFDGALTGIAYCIENALKSAVDGFAWVSTARRSVRVAPF